MVNPLAYVNRMGRRVLSRDLLLARPAILLGVFLLSALIGYRAAKLGSLEAILEDPLSLAIPLVIGGLLLVSRPAMGLVGVVVAAVVVPFELSTGTATRLNAGVLLVGALLGLWAFNMIVEKRRSLPFQSRTVVPLLIFVLAAVLSFVIGQLPWFMNIEGASLPAQLGALGLFVLAGGAFLLVPVHVRETRLLEWMVWIFLALGAVYLVGRALPGTNLLLKAVNDRVAGNSIFWIWMAVLSFSMAAFNSRLHPIWRLALGGLTLLVIYVSLVTDSGWTSGWLPALAGLAVVLLVSGTRWFWLSFVFLGIGVVMKWDSITGLLLVGDNEYSLFTRLAAWEIMFDLIKINPLFGLGPANYYWYTPLYSILGYAVEFNSHNNYLDLLAQTGLVGLAAFLWFAWQLWRLGWWLRMRAPEGFPRAYVFAALGGLASTLAAGMLGDWFLPFIYNVGFPGFRASLVGWMFLGGLVALEQIYRRDEGA